MHREFSTDDTPPLERHKYWHEVIGDTYFQLQLSFPSPETFQGRLTSWMFGAVSLSRLESSATCYKRLRQHLSAGNNEQFLVTIPEHSEVEFSQMGRNVRCEPGSFILEHSDEPYEFLQPKDNCMWVLKVPGAALRTRLRSVDRFCAMQLDARSGVGLLFAEYLRLVVRNLEHTVGAVQPLLGQQLIELVAAALEADTRILHSENSAVRAAHLGRIESYMRQNLSDNEMNPERIANACRISTRYLHVLFKETGKTVLQWLREARLQAAYEQLTRTNRVSVAEVAYNWGFGDQSQFCRAFKAHFGLTPREIKGVAADQTLIHP